MRGTDSVGSCVRADGSIKLGDKVFWSEASAKLAGSWVTVMLSRPEDDHLIVRLPSGDIRLDRLQDSGFANADACRARLTEYCTAVRSAAVEEQEIAHLERASVVRGQIEALVELVEQIVEDRRIAETLFHSRKVSSAFEKAKDFIDRSLAALLKRDEQGEQQFVGQGDVVPRLSQRVAELAARSLESREAVIDLVVQGYSPAGGDGAEPIPAPTTVHRLCEVGK
jgi:hypothetical protein